MSRPATIGTYFAKLGAVNAQPTTVLWESLMQRASVCSVLALIGFALATSRISATERRGPWYGLTPGFWKNHTEVWPDFITIDDKNFCFSTDVHVSSVFGGISTPALWTVTVEDALAFKGGNNLAGAERILLRAAVAALLNAQTLNYPLYPTQVVSVVTTALESENRDTILALATILDNWNNLGVPSK